MKIIWKYYVSGEQINRRALHKEADAKKIIHCTEHKKLKESEDLALT